jgi:hypothetical protein
MKTDHGFSMKLTMLLMCLSVVFLSCTTNAPKPADNDNSASIKKDAEKETKSETETETSGGLPPLVIDSSEPLLLDEPDEEAIAAANTEAAKENAACFVCHTNYRTEFLASSHAKVNISCYRCHGESLEHQNDENNTTPPETLYPAEKIDPFCRKCHQSHDVSPREVIARWKERGLEKTDPQKMVCTDCHGEHRMKVRTIIWDKKTGKLLKTNKGD